MGCLIIIVSFLCWNKIKTLQQFWELQIGNYPAIKSRSGNQLPFTLTGILSAVLPVHYWNGWTALCPCYCMSEITAVCQKMLHWTEEFPRDLFTQTPYLSPKKVPNAAERGVHEAGELIHPCKEDVVRAQNTGKAEGWDWGGHPVALCLKLQIWWCSAVKRLQLHRSSHRFLAQQIKRSIHLSKITWSGPSKCAMCGRRCIEIKQKIWVKNNNYYGFDI